MSTYTNFTLNFDLSTNANHQAFWGAVDAQIQGFTGWSYVSQTGDIDPNTAAAPANGSYAGFRVYSTTTGNSTTWYLRIDMGRNNGPQIKWQIGSGVNGSGTLTGQVGSAVTLVPQGTNTSANQSLHMAGTTGKLTIVTGLYSNTTTLNGRAQITGQALHGTVNGSGQMLSGIEAYYSENTTHFAQYIPTSGTVPPEITSIWPVAMGSGSSQMTVGTTNLFAFPVLWDANGNNASNPAGFGFGAGVAGGQTTTPTVYGTPHTYLATPMDQVNGWAGNFAAFLFE